VDEVHGINDAGTMLLGEWNNKAVKWTGDSFETQLSAGTILPGWVGVPQDIDAAGTIVGFDFLFGNRRAGFSRRHRQPD
jgi:hypothetical protein